MLKGSFACLFFFNFFFNVLAKFEVLLENVNAITPQTYAIWKNATIPFYVNPDHYDHEQTLAILTALSMFAFKTCIKFKPVMARPANSDHVMVFVNPDGTRRCDIEPKGHSVFNPHLIKLGYDCLKSPDIDMVIMKALGFPFEHNRFTRDLYIEVLYENIRPGAIELFTKEDTLPLELRFLPYDVHSVMHFNNREYSKNGHRTIIFKDHNIQQKRIGLTETDLKKIEIVYGPECRARDRQEKIDLCQSYPGVARKKRETEDNTIDEENRNPKEVERRKRNVDDVDVTKSLRVNPDITPPPENLEGDVTKTLKELGVTPPPENRENDVTKTLKELGIDQAVQELVDHVHKVTSLALKTASSKYCNNSEVPKITDDIKISRNSSDILGIIELVADFAKGIVDNAVKNLTKFCEVDTIEAYQRYGCDWSSGDSRCRGNYRSTKSGRVQYSTQHRPIIPQSTYHYGGARHVQYGRAKNDSEHEESESKNQTRRRKRDVETNTEKPIEIKKETEKADKNEPNEKEVAGKNVEEKVEKIPKVDDNKEVKSEQKSEVGGGGDKLEVKPKMRAELGDNAELTPEKKVKDGDNAKEKSEKNTQAEAKSQKKTEIDDNTKPVKKAKDVVSAKSKQKAEVDNKKQGKGNKGVKGEAKGKRVKVNNKQDLRTKAPGRRSYGRRHRAKHSPRYSEEEERDEEDREEQHKKKHGEETERKRHHEKESDEEQHKKKHAGETERERHKNKKGKHRTKHVPIRENNKYTLEPTEVEVKNSNNEEERQKEDSDESEETEMKDFEDRPQKRHKSKKEKDDRIRPLPKTVKLSKKNEEFYNERRWNHGELIYMIQEDTTYDLSDLRSRLNEVRKVLKKNTCVEMIEIQPGQESEYEDYIVIDNSPDYVTGRVGGRQNFGAIELFRGGQHRQHAAMMVMAMLGFYFEVSRHDRDSYIRVHMRHVRPDKLHHFEMIRSDATLPVPYDFASATHPAWQFWRQIGRSGISTVATLKNKDPDGEIMKSLGQNQKILSDIDIIRINSVYGIECFKPNSKKERSVMQNKTSLRVSNIYEEKFLN